MENNIPM